MHPASPRDASPVAGMKLTLARPEMTLRLACMDGLPCTLTQSAEPPYTWPVRTVVWEGGAVRLLPIPNRQQP